MPPPRQAQSPATPAGETTSPLTGVRPADRSYSLLMSIMEDALMLVAKAAQGRKRLTNNLYLLVTVAMFPAEGLLNGDQLQVLAVDTTRAKCTAALPNGGSRMLDLAAPLPIDHAYCRTVYASQGATCERVFIEADTASLTSSQSTFYVALSRARSEVTIFTDDAEHLAPAMARARQKNLRLRSPPRSR